MLKAISGKILTLDLATNIGVAVGDPSDRAEPRFWHHTLPSTGENVARFVRAFREWMTTTIQAELPIALVVFEAPVLMNGKTLPITSRKLQCLAGYCEDIVVNDFGLECAEENNMSVKKDFTGRGNAKKDDMVAEARRRGWKVATDDEADALAMWCFEARKFMPQSHWGRKLSLGPLGGAQ